MRVMASQDENALAQLASSAKTPGVPESIRESARHVLRHYPDKGDTIAIAEQSERGTLSGPLLDSAVGRKR